MPLSQTLLDRIPGCFGSQDHIFSAHGLDTQRARALLQDIWQGGYSYAEYINAMEGYMKSIGLTKEHINSQLKRIMDIQSYF